MVAINSSEEEISAYVNRYNSFLLSALSFLLKNRQIFLSYCSATRSYTVNQVQFIREFN